MIEDFNGFYICVILLPIVLGMGLYYGRKYINSSKTMYVVLWNLLITLTLLFTLFAGMETWYRFFVDTTDSYGLNMITQRWFKKHYEYNNIGIRDNVVYYPRRDPSKKHRITFFGDSFTEGHGVKEVDDRFVNIIRNSNPEWEVQTMAKKGNETNNEIESLNAYIDNNFELDYVVLCYCLNDISYLMPESKLVYDRIYGVYKKEMGFLDSSSYFVNTYYFRLRGSKDPAIYNYYNFVKKAYNGKDWDKQKEALEYFRKQTESREARLIVVTFPFLSSLGKNYEYETIHKNLDNFWKSQKIPHLDLLPVYRNLDPSDLVVNKYDAHPNEYAQKLAADAINHFLAKEIQKRINEP
jgi:hypothetical protein